MSARCAYCGTELKPNSMYCASCGQLASSPTVTAAAPAAPLRVPTLPAQPAPVPAPAPSPVAAPAAQPELTQRAFELVASTGERFRVQGTALVGRKPTTTDPAVTAVALDDPAKSISRAHVRLRVVAGALYVTDLGSANGTVLERAGKRTPCAPDRELEVRAGDRLWLGQVACTVLIAHI